MIRGSTVGFTLVGIVVGFVLFRIKYEVVELETKHAHVKKTIQSTKESIHVLKAEWAHLTDPARIQHLASKYLENGESLPSIVKTSQMKATLAKAEDKPIKKELSKKSDPLEKSHVESIDALLDVVPQKVSSKRRAK